MTSASVNILTMRETATKGDINVGKKSRTLWCLLRRVLVDGGVARGKGQEAAVHVGDQYYMVSSAADAAGNGGCECWVARRMKPCSRNVRVVVRQPEWLLLGLDLSAFKECVLVFHAPPENKNGSCFRRKKTEEFQLVAANTWFVEGGPTWTSSSGTAHRLDYVAVPFGWRSALKAAGTSQTMSLQCNEHQDRNVVYA